MFPHEVFQLFVQTVPDFFSAGGESGGWEYPHAVHHKHPILDTLEIIQCKIEDGSLVDFTSPQRLPGTDMVGNLRNQERLSDFGCSCEDICPCVKQVFNHRADCSCTLV